MKRLILFILSITFLQQSFAQIRFDSTSLLNCINDAKYICGNDSIQLDNFNFTNLKKDTTLIRYLLEMTRFNKKSISKIKKASFYWNKKNYSFNKDGDSIIYHIDFCLLKILKFKFLCKTYKGVILDRGLSLEQAYSSRCSPLNGSEQRLTRSFFFPKIFESLIILTKKFSTNIIGCNLLLVDNWDTLLKKYSNINFKNKKLL